MTSSLPIPAIVNVAESRQYHTIARASFSQKGFVSGDHFLKAYIFVIYKDKNLQKYAFSSEKSSLSREFFSDFCQQN